MFRRNFPQENLKTAAAYIAARSEAWLFLSEMIFAQRSIANCGNPQTLFSV
jgi:hypothetical protein